LLPLFRAFKTATDQIEQAKNEAMVGHDRLATGRQASLIRSPC
jgi:hypothetical protein